MAVDAVPGKIGFEQLELPLSRDDRLALIKNFSCAPIHGMSRKMREKLAKLLREIELNTGREGCQISRAVLAGKLEVDEATLCRWLDITTGRGLVKRDTMTRPDGGQAENRLSVNWDCVRWHGETQLVHAPRNSNGETLFVPDRGVDGETPFVPVSHSPDDSDASPKKDVATREQNATPPVAIATGGAANSPHYPIEGLNKTPLQTHSIRTNQRANSGLSESATGGRGGLPVVILDERDLRDPRRLAEWFRMAVMRKWAGEIDRLFVFTMAASAWRRSEIRGGNVRNPVGVFVRLIKRRGETRLRGAASQADEDWARDALRQLDRESFQYPDDV